jgi:folate-dependent tRNA-U54 methylase TrmFO/GidA
MLYVRLSASVPGGKLVGNNSREFGDAVVEQIAAHALVEVLQSPVAQKQPIHLGEVGEALAEDASP